MGAFRVLVELRALKHSRVDLKHSRVDELSYVDTWRTPSDERSGQRRLARSPF